MRKTIKNYLNGKKIDSMGEEFLDVIKEAETYFRSLSDKMGEVRSKYEVDYFCDDIKKLYKTKKLKKITTSWLQRRYKIGYAHSARIIDEFIRRKIVKKIDNSNDWYIDKI